MNYLRFMMKFFGYTSDNLYTALKRDFRIAQKVYTESYLGFDHHWVDHTPNYPITVFVTKTISDVLPDTIFLNVTHNNIRQVYNSNKDLWDPNKKPIFETVGPNYDYWDIPHIIFYEELL